MSRINADQFEALLFQEIRDIYGQGLPYFQPLRVLGSTVGYDFGVYGDYWKLEIEGRQLDSHILRGLLPVQRRALLPNKYQSVFLRIEHPQHVTSSRSKNPEVYQDWKDAGYRGYYRFEPDDLECRRLSELERNLGDTGTVMYASPAFTTTREADIARAAGTVLQQTHFQSPGALLHQEFYAYGDAHGAGKVYPGEREIAAVKFLREVIELRHAADVEPFLVHLARVWDVIVHVADSFADADEEDRDDPYDPAVDRKLAQEALGEAARLPAEPLHILGEGRITLPHFHEEDDRVRPIDLESFGAAVFAVHRLAREKFGCVWTVFYS